MSKAKGGPPPAVDPRVEELVTACRDGDEDGAGAMLALGACQVDAVGSGGLTPLVAAAEGGSVALVRMLLQHKASPSIATPGGGFPLRAAIRGGDGECILELLNAGVDVNQETSRGTALSTAACLGDVSTLKLLAERGASIDRVLRDGMSALMLAAREDKREAVKELLRAGADPDLCGPDGRSACDIAQAAGLQEVYSLLMQRSIVAAADSALQQSEQRQQDAQRERTENAARARKELHDEAEVAKAECSAKVNSLQAESAELLARMGISKPSS